MAGLSGAHQLAGPGDRRPALLHINLDQRLVLGIPTFTGSTEIERIIPLHYASGGDAIRLSGFGGLSGRIQLSVVDWDRDGRWDILFSATPDNIPVFYRNAADLAINGYLRTSSIFWLRNVGTNQQPVFEPARRFRYKDGVIPRVENHGLAATPVDLDGDGLPDIIAGDGPGFLHHFSREQLSWDN
jgi:hypothetical protein